jgi:hypothetical protein
MLKLVYSGDAQQGTPDQGRLVGDARWYLLEYLQNCLLPGYLHPLIMKRALGPARYG